MRLPALRLLAATLCLAACQNYEFQRVEPFSVSQRTQREVFAARRLKPNIMLLVDNSGSMLLPTNPADARCPAGCGSSQGNRCPATCPTRVSEMKAAMDSFLTNRGTLARFGLTVFPQIDQGDSCRAPVIVNEPLPPATRNDEGTEQALNAHAQRVNQALQAYPTPLGGTPTGAALGFVGTQPSLTDLVDNRVDLVLLLTDGLPNCNLGNAAAICDCAASGCPPAREQACACTLGMCDLGLNRCAIGCLDEDATVTAVRALRQKDIRTVVVGFGADVASGDGPRILKAMADEGGFARQCPNGTSAECGGSACDVARHQCVQSFYSASSATELEAELAKISERVPQDPCAFQLGERPSDPALLSVLVDGVDVQPLSTTWRYDDATSSVIFTGNLCTRLTASTPLDPVQLEFRIVTRF